MDRIRRLRNPIRDYAWGSRTALAELTGRPAPAPGPEAEMWMGAHASAPSEVEADGGRVSLLDWIRRDPEAVLGREASRRFAGALPFLFKLLAPERALSIQTHPDARQARAGFERENTAGLAADDPARCYRDPNPKPELICALSPFAALCGFRPAARIARALEALGVPELTALALPLGATGGGRALEAFFRELWGRDAERRRRLADAAAEAAARGRGEPESRRWLRELAQQHPGDIGVLAPLLLNVVELPPGAALFLPAGELHAYLRGVGVELMANSDNVLRGGLTDKHVDVAELQRTLTFREGAPPVLAPREIAPGLSVYDTPAREFELAVLRPGPGRPLDGPEDRSVEILLCTDGCAEVEDVERGESLRLERGQAVLVPAALPRYRVRGEATLHRAGVPR